MHDYLHRQLNKESDTSAQQSKINCSLCIKIPARYSHISQYYAKHLPASRNSDIVGMPLFILIYLTLLLVNVYLKTYWTNQKKYLTNILLHTNESASLVAHIQTIFIRNKVLKKYVLRIVAKGTPASNACIQDPKYFEQNVNDYSDVAPLLQKVHQNMEHTDFLSATHSGRQKEKGL